MQLTILAGAVRRALVGLRGAEAAAEALAPLCVQLVRRLAKPGATAGAGLPAALQALSSVGRLLPRVFAPHAQAVCEFVTEARERARCKKDRTVFNTPAAALTCAGRAPYPTLP